MADSAVAVIQLIDFTTRVARRVKTLLSNTKEVPEYLREIDFHLPLLIATLQQTVNEIENGIYTESTAAAMGKLVDECSADISKLEDTITLATPSATDTKRTRIRRAISATKPDRRVREVFSRLLRTIDGLVLIQTAASVKALERVRAV